MSGTAVAVKVGLSAAANSKTGKKIIGVLVGGLFLMMFMGGALVVSILSIFSDSGKVTKDFNAQSTAVYRLSVQLMMSIQKPISRIWKPSLSSLLKRIRLRKP